MKVTAFAVAAVVAGQVNAIILLFAAIESRRSGEKKDWLRVSSRLAFE